MDDIEHLFTQELPKYHQGYRSRPEQVKLARAISNAIVNRKHLLAEAPTGSGKSLAAIIPVALHAMETGQPVVYTTSHLLLQDQIVTKDLPLIKKLMEDVVEFEGEEPVEFRYEVVKGTSNYLCKLRLKENEEHLPPDVFNKIQKWDRTTSTGDRTELTGVDSSYWPAVSVSSDECLNAQCPFASECWVRKNRIKAKQAHVVVTNYALVFADLEVRKATEHTDILPPYSTIIMDEAHEASDVAMDFAGFQFSAIKLLGLLRHLTTAKESLTNMLKTNIRAMSKALPWAFVADTPFGDFGIIHTLRLVIAEYSRLASSQNASATTQLRFEKAAKTATAALYNLQEVLWGCVEVNGEVQLAQEAGGQFLDPDKVFYVERDKNKEVVLCCKATNTAKFFQQLLLGKTAIAMSATLTTGGTFEFVSKQLGLSESDKLVLESPFNAERVIVFMSPDIPDPSKDKNSHNSYLAAIVDRLTTAQGGLLLLCTSHATVQALKEALRESFPSILVLAQGEQSKAQIIEKFITAHKKGTRAVIVGTSSFWQGIDIPGQALSVVVIEKLPFPSPQDPVVVLKDRNGDNVFFYHSVPKAVIDFKQGVGRLIRSETDYGAIIIVDPRIRTKGYGAQFIRSLPSGCFETDSLDDVETFLREVRKENK